MQMYLWPGNQFGSQNQVSIIGVGDFGAGWAQVRASGHERRRQRPAGARERRQRGPPNVSDGCGPLVGFPAGAIAVVDRAKHAPLPNEQTQSAQTAGRR